MERFSTLLTWFLCAPERSANAGLTAIFALVAGAFRRPKGLIAPKASRVGQPVSFRATCARAKSLFPAVVFRNEGLATNLAVLLPLSYPLRPPSSEEGMKFRPAHLAIEGVGPLAVRGHCAFARAVFSFLPVAAGRKIATAMYTARPFDRRKAILRPFWLTLLPVRPFDPKLIKRSADNTGSGIVGVVPSPFL
jgi:hypothetical protein